VTLSLRPGRDDDADAIIALIGACWSEYPGIVLDVDGELPELRALATWTSAKGGAFWVAEAAGAIAGTAGVLPDGAGAWRITRMYVAADQRGTGLADALLAQAESFARDAGARRLTLFSDTRFARAHRFYERHGYVRSGPLVALQDRSNTIEYGYAKPVEGVEALDAAAAASAVRPLADILVACVDSGAAVSFMPPLARTDALAFWSRSAAAVARGERVIFAAWSDAEMAGTVTLDFAQQPNQPHRADIAKMMVRPCARRRGLARALMQAAEATAQARGRTLLTLDTRENDAAEPLYRSLGFIEAGRIPGYALNADGTLHATVIMYKPLGNPEAA